MHSSPGPLRVLRVIARLNVGGPAVHAVLLNDGLRQRQWETLLVYGSVAADEGSLEEMALARALPVAHIPELGRRLTIGGDALAFVKILRLLWRWRPDIVHTHTAKAGSLGRLAAAVYNVAARRSRRVGVIHTFHGHVLEGYFGRVGNLLVRAVERTMAYLTDSIVTISPRQRDDIVRRFAIAPQGKVVVVALGLELDALLALAPRATRRALPAAPKSDEVVIGYVGRLVPIKDLDNLLRAVALARLQLPNLRLVVAGDGELRTSLEALAVELGLAKQVTFLGWRRDLARLYASMDLFVLTSLNEGTPVSLIEAMAAGVPVIATAVGGVPDVVEQGVTGVLVPPQRPAVLAAAIVAALTEEERTARMADSARLSVRDRFDSLGLVRDTEMLYRRTLRRVRRMPPVQVPAEGSPGTVQ